MNDSTTKWLVKAPGEHGKGWRVVHSVGITMDNGKEVFAGIAEILHSRSSDDNFSDAKERERAEMIARDHNERAALEAVAEAAETYHELRLRFQGNGDATTHSEVKQGYSQLRMALANLAAVRKGKE